MSRGIILLWNLIYWNQDFNIYSTYCVVIAVVVVWSLEFHV